MCPKAHEKILTYAPTTWRFLPQQNQAGVLRDGREQTFRRSDQALELGLRVVRCDASAPVTEQVLSVLE
jgi:hypothetical protein